MDYLDILYQEEMKEELSEADDFEVDDEAPPYSPLSSPQYSPLSSPGTRERSRFQSRSRSRSRSPIRPSSKSAPSGVVLRVYNEEEKQLVEDSVGGEDFLAPDAHPLFISSNVGNTSESVLGERGGSERRGTRRGVRAIRGRSGLGHRIRIARQHGKKRWTLGDPLTEIYLNDADVPPAFVNMVSDVLRNRGIRAAGRAETNEGESDSDDEEYYDTNDTFEWKSMETCECKEEVFRVERTGSVETHNSPYDAFRSYWDDEVLNQIVSGTNLYASSIKSQSFHSEWVPTNIHEILCLFAFWMMLGIIRMPTIKSCFSVDPLLKTEVFRKMFTRTRYSNLSRAIHFVDHGPNGDKLYNLRPILEHLNNKFRNNYTLSKEICLDESLTLWKGELDMKQYIKSKAAKFGIKTFELCESLTGYLWSFIVYTGKESTSSEIEQTPGELKGTAVVKKLIAPLLNKGYKLFMDNCYNSPKLARFLKRNGTDCVGTLRPTRSNVPVLINSAPLRRGEIVSRHSGDMTVLAWQDKTRVTMISTCHGSSTGLPRVPSKNMIRQEPFKPQMVLEYNKFMGGVDLKDHMLEPYMLERKRCKEWYMKLFKRLLNASILNSRTLLQSSTKKNVDHLAFRLELVDSILSNHLALCPQNRKLASGSGKSTRLEPGRIVQGGHWPAHMDDRVQGKKLRKLCIVCLREGRKASRTTFHCEVCKVPLCVQNCFKSFHTRSCI